jgi:hypothetical protein
VQVATNFYTVTLADSTLHKYDITFMLPARDEKPARRVEKLRKRTPMIVARILREKYASELGCFVFDGQRQLYSTRGDLEGKVLRVVLNEKSVVQHQKTESAMDIMFNKTKELKFGASTTEQEFSGDIHQALELFIRQLVTDAGGQQAQFRSKSTKSSALLRYADREKLQGTDIIKIPAFVHSFLFRAGGVFLSVDYRYFFGFEGGLLVDCMLWYLQALGQRFSDSILRTEPGIDRYDFPAEERSNKLNSKLCELARVFETAPARLLRKLVKSFEGMSVLALHTNGKGAGGRPYTISKIRSTDTATTFSFPDKDTKEELTVATYFERKYKIRLTEPSILPLVTCERKVPVKGAEGGARNRFEKVQFKLPIEVLRVTAKYSRTMEAVDREKVTRESSLQISKRLKAIQDHMSALPEYDLDGHAVQLKINRERLQVEGRVLEAPQVFYGNSARPVHVDRGAWRLANTPFLKPVQGLNLLIIAPDRARAHLRKAMDTLWRVFNERCMHITDSIDRALDKTVFYGDDEQGESIVPVLRQHGHAYAAMGCALALVIVPRKKAERYNAVKAVGDIEVGIATQLITLDKLEKMNMGTAANIAAAINVKCPPAGSLAEIGQNQRVEDALLDGKTCFIGVDVFHAGTGPSRHAEAGFSASWNVYGTGYYSTHATQLDRSEEVLQLSDMLTEFLNQCVQNRVAPFERFVIIRDGLSDSQIGTIGAAELQRAKDTINAFYGNAGIAAPKYLYLVAQKRNAARFATLVRGELQRCAPGTVIDQRVVVDGKSFYLITYDALKNSPRPTYFYVLENELGLPLTVIETLMYKLSHLHPGCSRAVKLPMPLYNAHKISNRVGGIYRTGRLELEDTRSENSFTSDSSTVSQISVSERLKFTGFFL